MGQHADRMMSAAATKEKRQAERRMKKGEMKSTHPSSFWPKSVSAPSILPSADTEPLVQ